MATAIIRTVTMSLEERNLLVAQDGNWGQGVTIRTWEKGSARRVYVTVSGDNRDKSHMDLNNDGDLEMMFWNASAAQAVADFINALVEAQAPVIEEVVAEEISESVLRATVINSSLIDEAVAEMEAETARYHAHFAEQAAKLGMTGEELEMAFVDWRDEIVAPIAKTYNPDRPWFGWAHIQNSLNMWNIFFDVVADGDLGNLPKSLEYTGGEPEIVF